MVSEHPPPSTYSALKNLFMQWSLKRKILLCSVLFIAALLLIFAIRTYKQTDYQLLYANLVPEDYIELSDWLALRDIDFKKDPHQQSIYVSADSLHRARLQLAQNKLPRNRENRNDLIDSKRLAVIDAVTATDPSIALQLELAKTIAALDHIQTARVHLTPSLSYRSIDNNPSATVVVTVAPGRTLTSSQIQGVLHLLSASVAGLQPDRISIFDSSGSLISSDADYGTANLFGDSTLTYQASVERNLEKKAQDLLDAMIGRGQTLIRVAAELDFARNETTSERYDPEEPVLRSEHIQQEPAVEAGSGVDDPLESSPAAGGTGYRPSLTTSSKFDYEISKTTSKTIQPMGIIEQISVTVLVADEKSIEPDGSVSFKPRSDAELDSINSLVTSALSLKPDRGDSILLLRTPSTAMLRAVVPEEDSVFYDMLYLFPVGSITMIVFVFMLFYLLIIKPVIGILRTELDQQAQIIEAQRQEAFSDSETALEREDIAMVLKNEIENNPVAAAHVIKKWIQET